MTIENLLEQRFWKLGLQIQPGLDTTTDSEYVVYSYNSDGALYGDDGPVLEHRRWSVVYVAPLARDRRAMRNDIRVAIYDVTGIWPGEDDNTDGNGQCFTYEFETFGGVAYGEIGRIRN